MARHGGQAAVAATLRHALAAAMSCVVACAGHGPARVQPATSSPRTHVPQPASLPPPVDEPAVASVSELAALDLGERLDRYQAQGAQWTPGQPLIVSCEFDFGAALSLDTIGPSIAAAKRKDANVACAARLAQLPRVEPQALLALLRERCAGRCRSLDAARVRLYGVLFGEQRARLRVVLEVLDGDGAHHYAAVTAARPLVEFEQPGSLQLAFEAGVSALPSLLDSSLETPAPSEEIARCAVGDGAFMRGRVVARAADRALLAIIDPPPAVLSCPSEAVMLEPVDGR